MISRGRFLIWARSLALAAGAGLLAVAAHADDPLLLHRREHENRSIEPVNVEVKYGVVTGTITVRSGGVLVNPQQVSYAFQPEFPGSQGSLYRVADGIYVLHVPRVPTTDSHTLIITSAYNDTIVRDNVVQRLGETTTGTLQLQIPFGRDRYDVGDQLLDLR